MHKTQSQQTLFLNFNKRRSTRCKLKVLSRALVKPHSLSVNPAQLFLAWASLSFSVSLFSLRRRELIINLQSFSNLIYVKQRVPREKNSVLWALVIWCSLENELRLNSPILFFYLCTLIIVHKELYSHIYSVMELIS